MPVFNKFNSYAEAVSEKVHNLAADTLRVMLTNTAPVATNTVLANLIDLTPGNGYTAGGLAPSLTSSSQIAGLYKLVLVSVTFTASGGAIGPFRYPVLYNASATNKELIGWWDYGSSITLNPTETFAVNFDASLGVLTLQ